MKMSNQRSRLDHLPVVLRISQSSRTPKRLEMAAPTPAEPNARSRSVSSVLAGALLLGSLGLGITLAVREPTGSSTTPGLVKLENNAPQGSEKEIPRNGSTSKIDPAGNEDLNTILRAEYVEGSRPSTEEVRPARNYDRSQEESNFEPRRSSNPPRRIGRIDGVSVRRLQPSNDDDSR